MIKCSCYHITEETRYLTDFEQGVRFEKIGKRITKEKVKVAHCRGTKDCEEGSAGITAYAGATGRAKNIHPAVKPTALVQYLIRLVTPRGGTILDPFMGSGSTGKAAFYENFDRNADYKFIGIEMTAEYLPIAAARIEFAMNDKRVVETEQPASEQSTDSQVKFDL